VCVCVCVCVCVAALPLGVTQVVDPGNTKQVNARPPQVHLPQLRTIRITGKNDTTPAGKHVLEEACRERGIKIEG